MKKVSILLIVAMTMSLAFVSCGGGSSNTPADMEMKLMSYAQKGDYKKMVDYWLDNSIIDESQGMTKAQMKSMSSMLIEKMKEPLEAQGGVKSVKLVKEEISEDGMTAKVHLMITYGDGTEEEKTSPYKKVDGEWKMDGTMK